MDVIPLHGSSPIGPVGVATAVLAALDAAVPTMGDAYRREVAEYAAMDDEDFAEVLRTSAAFVGRFAKALADGVDRPLPDHPTLVAAGRRRQQDGISLDAAMHAFRIASREGWTLFADAAATSAPRVVSDLASRWLEYADRASTAFAEGHSSATNEQLRRLDARRQALVADLLSAADGAAAAAVGRAHGIRLADVYTPILLDGDAVAEDRVESLVPVGAIVARRGGALVALVPGTEDDVEIALVRLQGLGTCAHGEAATPGRDLLDQVVRAEAVLQTAARLGRTGRLGPGDLALHRAVAEHDGLGEHLRSRVLDPLVEADKDGVFRETLRAYLADGAIRTVADALFVHANTVTYRLRRVRECTGLDPRVPAQAAELVLALALADLEDGGGS